MISVRKKVNRDYFGAKNPAWKGSDVGYHALHCWLGKYFKKLGKCDFCSTRIAKRTEWALKKGCKYSRNIKDYLELCVSCHKKYDYTEDMRKRISAWSKTRTGDKHPMWKGGDEYRRTPEWKKMKREYLEKWKENNLDYLKKYRKEYYQRKKLEKLLP